MLIEEEVVKYFSDNGLWLASAESCTGGLISKRITDVPGASAMFGYGVCTYANEAKIKLLGVLEETLNNYGAVSSQVALQMAEGLLRLSGADVAVCTTGIASPVSSPTPKPLGLVYVGIASKAFGVRSLELHLGELKTREKIRTASADKALSEALLEAKAIINR